MTTGTRKTGQFCWINMLTAQPMAAREFFGKLLGWTYFEMPGIGHGVLVGGRNIGGIFDLEGPNTPKGTRPVIGVMVKVESADAICREVTTLGGKSRPAFDILDRGRMSVCSDPNGADFDVWEPKKMQGTDVDSTLHGAPSWFESLTSNVERAAKFYTGLFGWSTETKSMPGFDYTIFKQGSEQVGGMMPILPHMGSMKPHWATYFTVNDANESASLAAKLGGKLCVPVQDIPGIGRFCGINSPQGVTFFAIEYLR
jgi:predicted enzyme related to lactoylglutathione lyase